MSRIRALRGIFATADSMVVPMAFQSSESYVTRHLGRANIRTGLLHRLFPSSLHYSTKSSFAELIMQSMDYDKEVQPDHQKVFHFKVEECPGQQTLVLTNKYKDEIFSVEVYMPESFLLSEEDTNNMNDYYDDEERTNQSTIKPFIAKVLFDKLNFVELWCTTYPDKIILDCLTRSGWPIAPYSFDYLAKLHKSYCRYLHARGINLRIICYLHELKLQLNRLRRCFAKHASLDLSPGSMSSEELLPLIRSALTDFCCCCHFSLWGSGCSEVPKKDQVKVTAECFSEEDLSLHSFGLCKNHKEETIWVEVVKPCVVGNKERETNYGLIFSLLGRGLFMEFHCTLYPHEISLNGLRIGEGCFASRQKVTGASQKGDESDEGDEGMQRLPWTLVLEGKGRRG